MDSMFAKKRLYAVLGFAGLCLLAWILAGTFGFRRAPEALIYHGKSVETWALQLRMSDPKARDEAVAALKAMGPTAVPGLVRLLQARDSLLRKQAWAAVSWLPAPFQNVVVTKVAPPNATAVRIAAARSLAIIGPDAQAAVPALAWSLQNDVAQVRWMAASALGRIGPPAWAHLTSALAAADPNLRYAAVAALGDTTVDPKLVVPKLLKALQDTDSGVVAAAAGSLGKLGAGALPVVMEVMTNGDAFTRVLAARAVPLLRQPRDQVLPALFVLRQDTEPACRAQALRSLGALGIPNKTMIDEAIGAFGDTAPEVRLAGIELALQWSRRTAAAVPSLAKCLTDESPAVRQAAARALGAIGTPAKAALQELNGLANDGDAAVRLAAKEAVAKIEPAAEGDLRQ